MKTIIINNEIFEAHNHVFRGFGLKQNYNRIEFRAESESGKTLKKWVFPMDDTLTFKELQSEFTNFILKLEKRFCNCDFEKGLNEMNFKFY